MVVRTHESIQGEQNGLLSSGNRRHPASRLYNQDDVDFSINDEREYDSMYTPVFATKNYYKIETCRMMAIVLNSAFVICYVGYVAYSIIRIRANWDNPLHYKNRELVHALDITDLLMAATSVLLGVFAIGISLIGSRSPEEIDHRLRLVQVILTCLYCIASVITSLISVAIVLTLRLYCRVYSREWAGIKSTVVLVGSAGCIVPMIVVAVLLMSDKRRKPLNINAS